MPQPSHALARAKERIPTALLGAALALAVFLALRRLWPRTPLAGPFPAPLAAARASAARHKVV
jgi:hypothetical protein